MTENPNISAAVAAGLVTLGYNPDTKGLHEFQQDYNVMLQTGFFLGEQDLLPENGWETAATLDALFFSMEGMKNEADPPRAWACARGHAWRAMCRPTDGPPVNQYVPTPGPSDPPAGRRVRFGVPGQTQETQRPLRAALRNPEPEQSSFHVSIQTNAQLVKWCNHPDNWRRGFIVSGPNGSQKFKPLFGLADLDWQTRVAWYKKLGQWKDKIRTALLQDQDLDYRFYGEGKSSLRDKVTKNLVELHNGREVAEGWNEGFETRRLAMESMAGEYHQASFVWPLSSVDLEGEPYAVFGEWNQDFDMPQGVIDQLVEFYDLLMDYCDDHNCKVGNDLRVSYGSETMPWETWYLVKAGKMVPYVGVVSPDEGKLRSSAKEQIVAQLRRAARAARCAQLWAAWGVVRPQRKALGKMGRDTVKAPVPRGRFTW